MSGSKAADAEKAKFEADASTHTEQPRPGGNGAEMTTADLRLVQFVLGLIDHLAQRHDFDPAELISPRTGRSLAPALERLRNAVRQRADRS